MATKSLLKEAMTLVEIIEKDGEIHKFDLMDKASMSMSKYEKIAPYLKHRFGHKIHYSKEDQKWILGEDPTQKREKEIATN